MNYGFMPVYDEVQSGLEGIVAFATEIAEPDRDGDALRYRGVDIEELVGKVPFEQVWGLLVDDSLLPGLQPAAPYPLGLRTRATRVPTCRPRLRRSARSGASSRCSTSPTSEARDNLALASVMALSFVAQSARGFGRPPVPQSEIDSAQSIAERFLTRWRGEADPRHARAIDAYWTAAAEHGVSSSTFTARVIASTGADVAAALSAAVGALSGPLHGGAPARVLQMLDEVEAAGDATSWVETKARSRRADHGLRPPCLPCRGPARPRAAADHARARLARGSRSPRRSSAPPWRSSRRAARSGSSPPTSSSGRRSCSTSPRFRPRSTRRCSAARASPAGRRTSSSRSARAA